MSIIAHPTTQSILSRLAKVKPTGAGKWTACCPAHDDKTPSLSVSVGQDGRTLVNCFSGCTTKNIVSALGLKMADLFPAPDRQQAANRNHAPRTYPTWQDAIRAVGHHLGTPSATWQYHSATGDVVAVVGRWDGTGGKTYRPASRHGDAWRIGDPSNKWPIYRLPSVLSSDGPVYVVEGERCADMAARLGLIGTTSAHGAQSPGKTDWTPLAGKDVVILPDADDAGAKYAQSVAAILSGLTPPARAKIVALPGMTDGEDIVDFVQRREEDGHDDPEIRQEITDLAASVEWQDDTALWSDDVPIDPENPPDGQGEATPPGPCAKGGFRNFFEAMNEDEKIIRIGYPARTLHDALQEMTGGWPKVANGMLFVPNKKSEPLWLPKPAEMFAWIAGNLREATTNPLLWVDGSDKVKEQQFHAFIRQNAEQYSAVEPYPHHPPMPGHYYMHPPLPSSGDGRHLRKLLDQFTPSTLIDRDLLLSAILTLFVGIEPGQRPAFLIKSDDDDKLKGVGVGKTTFAKMIARLCGGYLAIRSKDTWEAFITRLLSPAALTMRVALIDNVKTLRFSWAELEEGITSEVISGRQLYVGEGRRPNTLTYFITLNGANMSRDMAQRCVPIVLERPAHNANWLEETIRLIDNHRWEIIADIIAILRAPGVELTRYSRWSTWERAVLSRVGEPSDCQKVIAERQSEIDDDRTGAEMVRDGFREELIRRGHSPDRERIRIPSEIAGQIINTIENDPHRTYPRAMAHLYTLAIEEIKKSNRKDGRGCIWNGVDAQPTTPCVRICDPYR